MTTTQARTEPDHASGTDPHAGTPTTAAAHGNGHGPHGYSAQKDAHLKRLRRIEGQIRGLQRMVDEDVYCIDILTQVSAINKALHSVSIQLLEDHVRHCVVDAATQAKATGNTAPLDDKISEAMAAITRLIKS